MAVSILDAIINATEEEYDRYMERLWDAPGAYSRAATTLRCIEARHPWNHDVTVIPRDGDGDTPIWFTLASKRGCFNKRAYELRVAARLRDGVVVLDEDETEAWLLATSAHRREEGWVYVYPMPVGVALSEMHVALPGIADDASMQDGRTEHHSDEQGWTICICGYDDPDMTKDEIDKMLRWYFDREAGRWAQEAAAPRRYAAFRESWHPDDDNGNTMVVRGERMRQMRARVDESQRPPRIENIRTIIEGITVDVAYSRIACAEIGKEGERVGDTLREISRQNAFALDPAFYAVGDGAVKFVIEAYDRSENLDAKLSFVFCRDYKRLSYWKYISSYELEEYGRESVQLPAPLAYAVLRNVLVKVGIRQALEKSLVEEDEYRGYPVPVDERDLPYEEYLRLGLDWLEENAFAATDPEPVPEDSGEGREILAAEDAEND
ncbi:hypothetical protein HMPREF2946_07195 [Actinomyces sp. HMSC062G12]|nr:hypothetical protein HMPREF2946_07195 [Actinomyces sp. HMSC062G12]